MAVAVCSITSTTNQNDISSFLLNATIHANGPSIEELGLPVYIISDDVDYITDEEEDEECMIDMLSIM